MAEAGLEHEVELAIPERHLAIEPSLLNFFSAFGVLAWMSRFVLDAPGIHAPLGAARDQLALAEPATRSL